MGWEERTREAVYESPSGVRITFAYEALSNTKSKKTSAFNFADADGTFVQETGNTGYSIPMRCIFWGDDYDEEAQAFDDALSEPGIGTLEHPVYGVFQVVPTGDMRRRDDRVESANEAVFDVTFLQTIELIFPAGEDNPASEVATGVSDFNEAVAGDFAAVADVESAVGRSGLKGSYQNLLDKSRSTLEGLASATEAVQAQFDDINTSINAGIDTLIAEPLTLAFQTTLLIQAPARAAAAVRDRLDAYKNLADDIISGNTISSDNDFAASDLFAQSFTTGAIVSAINADFATRSEAVNAAVDILDQFSDLQTWRESNLDALDIIDTGAAYQRLQETAAKAAGYLVEISFNLAQERSITLSKPRTIIDIAAEVYGSVDDRLDLIIQTNDLAGDEILEVPAGRTIVYYR